MMRPMETGRTAGKATNSATGPPTGSPYRPSQGAFRRCFPRRVGWGRSEGGSTLHPQLKISTFTFSKSWICRIISNLEVEWYRKEKITPHAEAEVANPGP